jgi:hypothetical protein
MKGLDKNQDPHRRAAEDAEETFLFGGEIPPNKSLFLRSDQRFSDLQSPGATLHLFPQG